MPMWAYFGAIAGEWFPLPLLLSFLAWWAILTTFGILFAMHANRCCKGKSLLFAWGSWFSYLRASDIGYTEGGKVPIATEHYSAPGLIQSPFPQPLRVWMFRLAIFLATASTRETWNWSHFLQVEHFSTSVGFVLALFAWLPGGGILGASLLAIPFLQGAKDE